jgi:hypothetical protein
MSSIRRTILRGMEKHGITRINEAGNRKSRRAKNKKKRG